MPPLQPEEEKYRAVKLHAKEVHELLNTSADVVTLVVGEKQVKFMCHKALLGYYSKSFEASLYGNFKQEHAGEFPLPEESPDVVEAFVSWLYTGCIFWDGEVVEDQFSKPYNEGVLPSVRLWVLGDKFLSFEFCNAAMDLTARHFATNDFLEAKSAEFAYKNTVDGSELRLFIKALIMTEGPFAKELARVWEPAKCEKYHEEWVLLLAKGGDIVKDCVSVGFKRWSSEKTSPWSKNNLDKYMRFIDEILVVEWREKHNLELA